MFPRYRVLRYPYNIKVEVTVTDHRADPGQGRSEAERLIQQENVDMLYGCYNSSALLA
jgi:branched-chain amino acid transport system substrate-binding protein